MTPDQVTAAHVADSMVAILTPRRYRRWFFWVCLPFLGSMCAVTVYRRYPSCGGRSCRLRRRRDATKRLARSRVITAAFSASLDDAYATRLLLHTSAQWRASAPRPIAAQ